MRSLKRYSAPALLWTCLVLGALAFGMTVAWT